MRSPRRRSRILAKSPEAAAAPCGILLLDKPRGLTSNGALQRVRSLFGRAKGGHTGSLDPLATGMLPICLGEATKLAGSLLAGRKAYEFELQLGARTDTGDADGQVIERLAVPRIEPEFLQSTLRAATGPQLQVPPMYSALKQAGQPLYKLARQGLSVAREPRPIVVESLELLEQGPDWLRLRAACSKGTYIRVLAEDLARTLGTGGYLSALRRLWVEPFMAAAMHTLEALADRNDRESLLLPADRAVLHLPAVHLGPAAAQQLRHGQAVRAEHVEFPSPQAGPAPALAGPVRLYAGPGEFLGLGEALAGDLVQPRRLLHAPGAPDS